MSLILLLRHASPRLLLGSLGLGVLSGACGAGLLALINAMLGGALPPAPSMLGAFALLALLTLASNVVAQALMIRLGQDAVLGLRLQLSRSILATPLRQLESLGAHRLLAALTDDVLDLSNALFNLPILCIHLTTLALCLLLLGWLSWQALLLGAGFMALGIASYQLMVSRALARLERARAEQDQLFQHYQSLTQGIKELKLHGGRARSFLDQTLLQSALAHRQQTVGGLTLFGVARGWGDFLFFAFIGLVLFALPALGAGDPATLSGVVLLILYTITPLTIIMNLLPVLGRGIVAHNKVRSLGLELASAPARGYLEPQQPQPRLAASYGWRRLELDQVTHGYLREREERGFMLGPLSLAFQPGELVFLVGGNGSGKTTLAKLLSGLYTPESGCIRLDGEPIGEHNREGYRQLFSAVFYDFCLFEQLLGLGAPQLEQQARDYLALLQLDHLVRIEQDRLSTLALSQGQRKRLALLTAYLEDRPFYLFDEWAADQDPLFKELFYTRMLPDLKARGKAVLVITHDDRYFHLADRLLKLEDGQVLENVIAQERVLCDDSRAF